MSSASLRTLAFTLLEVLAAVAILALVYTVLARIGIQSFRAEGGADRRLRASLLADEVLAEIEGQVEMGSALPLGEKDAKQGEFTVHVRVSPAEIKIPPPSQAAAQRLEAAEKRSSDGSAGNFFPGHSFFQAEEGVPPPGRRIEVRVSWTEGAMEPSVVRETYALDPSVAAGRIGALDAMETKEQAGAVDGGPLGKAPAPGAQSGQAGPPGATSPGMGLTP